MYNIFAFYMKGDEIMKLTKKILAVLITMVYNTLAYILEMI